MRVAHVNDIAFVASTLVRAMRDLGVDASLIDLPRPGARLPRPLAIATSPLRQAAWLGTVPRLRRSDADLLHVHYAWRALVALPAGHPFVVHCHGSDVRGLPAGSLRARLDRHVLRRAAAVYYATPDIAPVVRSWRPDASFVPSPIDDERFSPGSAPETDVLVGVRAHRVKGADVVAELVGRLSAVRPSTSMTVVAHGPASERIVVAAGSRARVIDPVGHDEMPALLRRHRVAIGQASVGALGNYELEALASGVPVAAAFRFPEAYDVGPPTVWADDPDATVEAIVALLDGEDLRLASAAAGRAWLVAHHGARAIAARLIDDYGRILGGPGR